MSVELSFRDNLAFLTLNRPEALNALSFAVLREISAAFDEVKASDARALVVCGRGGKAFCAGADIKELRGRSMVAQREGAVFGQSVFRQLDQLLMPSVAVINGYAFGGGLELALACTFRVATPSARMGLPEIRLGLVPGYGGTQRLPRLVGPARALELIMSGRTVDAAEAERIGLANRVVDDGDPHQIGQDFCAQFIGYSAIASMLARQAVLRACDVSLEEGLRIEADLSTLAFQSDDAEEGMRAFIEKRKPQFSDR
ncbi:3-hydroxypropionyl-coenzyme A dehydratase [Paraburkholderia xenovorans LB400]|uniref:Short chain enoyl-CoA hydratase n=1 Tax=Paraburkholderia xenovorans (strain LB400) TaxID=266265 RepID=Q13G87_PARXL|nr:enoyl-CoA hydratase-related protein [Paraburkholderia xenovorans]ABE36902.1 short chain enoyl-CoA hydratase [Paraburkholderia xenovorans LB400]AIP34033.1 3-hydroxypropionyl-coenzyme A dehydratase [Paraburkholderia xenovorans LB400]